MTKSGEKVLIIAADFYQEITESLIRGAHSALGTRAAVVRVPGALELPQALNLLSAGDSHQGCYEGYVALGCVIKGETDHYRLVADCCSRGIFEVALRRNLAVGFGVITAASRRQAEVRAAEPPGRNLGFRAAEACLRLLQLKKSE